MADDNTYWRALKDRVSYLADILYRNPVNYMDSVKDRIDEIGEAFSEGYDKGASEGFVSAVKESLAEGLEESFSPAIEMAVDAYEEHVEPIIDDVFGNDEDAVETPAKETLESLKRKFDEKYKGVDLSSNAALQNAYLAAFSEDSTDAQRLYGLKDLSYAIGNGKLGLEGSDRQMQFDFLDYSLNNFESADNSGVYAQVVRDHAYVKGILEHGSPASSSTNREFNIDDFKLRLDRGSYNNVEFNLVNADGQELKDVLGEEKCKEYYYKLAEELREVTGDETGWSYDPDQEHLYIDPQMYDEISASIKEKYGVEAPAIEMTRAFTNAELSLLGVTKPEQIVSADSVIENGVETKTIEFMGADGVREKYFESRYTEEAVLPAPGEDSRLIGDITAELSDDVVRIRHSGIMNLQDSGVAGAIVSISGQENFVLRGSEYTLDNYVDVPREIFVENLDKFKAIGIDVSAFEDPSLAVNDVALDESIVLRDDVQINQGFEEFENSEMLQSVAANLGVKSSIEIKPDEESAYEATFSINKIA